eukprot:3112741-Rhodomonas_salina.1
MRGWRDGRRRRGEGGGGRCQKGIGRVCARVNERVSERARNEQVSEEEEAGAQQHESQKLTLSWVRERSRASAALRDQDCRVESASSSAEPHAVASASNPPTDTPTVLAPCPVSPRFPVNPAPQSTASLFSGAFPPFSDAAWGWMVMVCVLSYIYVYRRLCVCAVACFVSTHAVQAQTLPRAGYKGSGTFSILPKVGEEGGASEEKGRTRGRATV